MLDDLSSGREIARETEKLLKRADAEGRLPTPVEDLVAAAKLAAPKQSWLSDSAISEAPARLRRAMRKLKGKTNALLDRETKEIHLNPDISHEGQRRFKTTHEVTHHILPWQHDLVYADDNNTLSWRTKVEFEREANQGGAELLFQRQFFQQMAADYAIGFPAIIDLADKFKASYHASFRRYVETHKQAMAGLVLEISPCRRDPVGFRRREAVCSAAWRKRYEPPATWPTVLCAEPYGFVDEIPRVNGFVPPRFTFAYPNLNNEPTNLQAELFSNSYSVFVLMWLPRSERFKRKRVIVPAPASA